MCLLLKAEPFHNVEDRFRETVHLGLRFDRCLEVVEDQDEDKKVVHTQALLQKVSSKELFSLCGSISCPYAQSKEEGTSYV